MFEGVKIETLVITVLLILGIIGAVFAEILCNTIMPFREKRDYIMMEMERSDGNERDFWKEKLEKLYKKTFPLLGEFLCKFIK